MNERRKRNLPAIHQPDELLIGRFPPQAIALEESILGAVILEDECYHMVADMLLPEVFYREQNGIVCKAIVSLKNRNEKVDLITVVDELRRLGELEIAGGAYYISTLTNRVGSAANIESHMRMLLEKYIKRTCIQSSTELIRNSYDETTDALENLETYEKNLITLSSQLFIDKMADTTVLDKQFIDDNIELTSRTGAIIGITSGFRDLDIFSGGWQNSDLIIMAGRPGMGKTALAIQCAMNAALAGQPAAIFSLEMSRKQVYKRLLSQISDIPHDFFKKGLDKDSLSLLQPYRDRLTKAPLYIDDSGSLSIFDFRQKARKLMREKKIKLIILDYLQLMHSDGKSNREQEISQISRGLKATAKELDIPIIALSQLSRETERGNAHKIPKLSDLRDSGAIEQDADIVGFIYRPEYYNITHDGEGNSTKGLAKFIIAKNRHGAIDDVDLKWKGECMQFKNYVTTYEEKLSELADNTGFVNEGHKF